MTDPTSADEREQELREERELIANWLIRSAGGLRALGNETGARWLIADAAKIRIGDYE